MILANGNFVADYTKLVQAALVVMRSRHIIVKAMHGHGLVIYVWAACFYWELEDESFALASRNAITAVRSSGLKPARGNMLLVMPRH